jgi:hypothetical protein
VSSEAGRQAGTRQAGEGGSSRTGELESSLLRAAFELLFRDRTAKREGGLILGDAAPTSHKTLGSFWEYVTQ